MELINCFYLGFKLCKLKQLTSYTVMLNGEETPLKLLKGLNSDFIWKIDRELSEEISNYINEIERKYKKKQEKYLDNQDSEVFKEKIIKWIERISANIKNRRVIELFKGGNISYEQLIQGPESFFLDYPGIWKKLTDITKSDLSDACKCLLYKLPTPTAMLSLRSIEDALRIYYKHVKNEDYGSKTWKGILDELLKVEGIDDTLVGHLNYIRKNKRNLAAHPDKIFKQNEAGTILLSVVETIATIYENMEKA